MSVKTASVDGITMRWEEQGEGTPIILIHGIPILLARWRRLMPRLSGALRLGRSNAVFEMAAQTFVRRGYDGTQAIEAFAARSASRSRHFCSS